MAGLNAAMKNRITEALDSTHFTHQGFTLKYDDVNNPMAIITFSSSPVNRFIINSTDAGAFTTSERPGIHSDTDEIFQRSSFELCIDAVKQWAERIVEGQEDWILDEFGGVADRLPNYKQ